MILRKSISVLNFMKTIRTTKMIKEKKLIYLDISTTILITLYILHFIQPISYYYECVEQLLKMNDNVSKIHVLSDDIEWIKEKNYLKEIYFILSKI